MMAGSPSGAGPGGDVGPAAPTLAGAWTAGDVAAHVVSLDRLGGVPTFVGRTVVSRGIRLNDAARRFADAGITSTRRRGFAWVLERLRSSPPRILLRGRLAPIGLFEVFVHHEDVRRASGRWPRRSVLSGSTPDVVLWLAGRRDVADVELQGDDAAVEQMRDSLVRI